MMLTHSRPQSFEPAVLQLFDCAFAPVKRLGDLANALLFHETKLDDAALFFR
jgi:hypothetical protein